MLHKIFARQAHGVIAFEHGTNLANWKFLQTYARFQNYPTPCWRGAQAQRPQE